MTLCAIAAAPAAEPTPAWVELADDGQMLVCTVVTTGSACPSVTADDVGIRVQQRSTPDNAFPLPVCEASVPVTAKTISVGGTRLPTLKPAVNRVAVIGDTGCRLAGRAVQDCADPNAWPFPVIAKATAAKRPDLVIHVGDFLYRESACPAGRAGCAGSPHGDNWPTWRAELFDPAAVLFAAAPWVVIRGNHEVCKRAGHGWFRLLDPSPFRIDCADRTDPYRVSAGGVELLVFDDGDADDFTAPPDKVAAYAAQLAPLLAKAPPHAWLVTHRPVWAMAQADLSGLTGNQTMQQAIKDYVPANLDMVLSGHLHDFLSYDFGPQRPPQLVVGTGGDTLLKLGRDAIVGAELDGLKVQRGFAAERFSYLILERTGDGWDGTLYATDDTILARCHLAGRAIDCK